MDERMRYLSAARRRKFINCLEYHWSEREFLINAQKALSLGMHRSYFLSEGLLEQLFEFLLIIFSYFLFLRILFLLIKTRSSILAWIGRSNWECLAWYLLRETELYPKYDNLKLVNFVQTNEILLIENSTYLNIRFEIFGWICMYI